MNWFRRRQMRLRFPNGIPSVPCEGYFTFSYRDPETGAVGTSDRIAYNASISESQRGLEQAGERAAGAGAAKKRAMIQAGVAGGAVSPNDALATGLF